MGGRRVSSPTIVNDTPHAPALTPEARENQLITLAHDLAEKQLRDGTASAQVISQLLKAGSTRDRLEKAKMDKEVELLKQKSSALESAERMEKMYGEALNAMRRYGGQEPLEPELPDFDD